MCAWAWGKKNSISIIVFDLAVENTSALNRNLSRSRSMASPTSNSGIDAKRFADYEQVRRDERKRDERKRDERKRDEKSLVSS